MKDMEVMGGCPRGIITPADTDAHCTNQHRCFLMPYPGNAEPAQNLLLPNPCEVAIIAIHFRKTLET